MCQSYHITTHKSKTQFDIENWSNLQLGLEIGHLEKPPRLQQSPLYFEPFPQNGESKVKEVQKC